MNFGAVDLAGGGASLNRATSNAVEGLLTANRVDGTLNVEGLAASLAELATDAPDAAADALEALTGRLSPAELGTLERVIPEALQSKQADLIRSKTDAAGLTDEQLSLVADLGQLGLDIVGLFDPTPISDGLNGIISLFRGDFLGAGLSAVSMVPYIGDAAKLGKLGKWAETAANAIELAAKNPEFARAAEPALRKIKDSLESIPDFVRNNLPESAVSKLDDMRVSLARHFKDPVIDGRPQTYGQGGTTGNWSPELNARNLTPSADYNVNGYTYKTDTSGRVTSVEGKLDLETADRNGYQQRVSGREDRLPDDEGGHLIASIFNGPGERVNLVPMDGNFNKGAWKSLETKLADALKDGKDVQVNIDVIYKGGTERPEAFSIQYSIDGVVSTRNFLNQPGG